MIDHLLAELGEKLDLTAAELADVIWLTLIRQEGSVIDDKVREPKREAAAVAKPDVATAPAPSPTPKPEPRAQSPATSGSSTGIISPRSSTTNTVLNRLPIKVANPPSLRNPLALARSLRPLMQKVPSGRVEGLDEQATAQQIAEAGIWQPIVKPILEPWLEIALVADESASMLIWRQTVLEFRKLLRNYGAFRDVQLWGLHCEGESLCLRPGIGSDALHQPTRQPEELLDPSGRRLILLITDCVSSYWQEEVLIKTLKRWAQQSPIAIAQVLPEWLWVRTAIRGFEPVQLAGLEPGVPNSQLVVDWSSVWQSSVNPQAGVCLPIVPLEPDSMLTWSQMVTGRCEAPGYWLRSFPSETDLPASASQSPAQQLERFQLISSPVAQRLMGLVAASPVITLPVIRLIQETLLPKSQQMHVAEVLLGGLLEPIIPPTLGTIPDEMEYRFIDEAIRDLLLAATPVPDTVQVLSGYVERQFDQSLDEFVAELQLWSQSEDIALVDKARSFATVTANVLKRKGGRYREIVQQVERQDQHHAIEEAAQSRFVSEQDQQEVELAATWICELSFSAHDENVTCVCFSPDGLLVASSSDDSTIRLWNLQGQQIGQCVGHSDFVRSISFSPDGHLLASAGNDKTVRLWDLQGNQIGQPLQRHEGVVTSVAFSPSGQVIASGSSDRTVRLWDLQGSSVDRPFQGHEGLVNSVAFSPNSRMIASGSGDGAIRLWTLFGKPIGQPLQHRGAVVCVAFSWDSQLIASGSADGTLRLWNSKGKPVSEPIQGHAGKIYSIAFSPDGQRLVSSGKDSRIRVWDLEGNPIGEPLEGHRGGVNAVAFSPDGQLFASCSSDRSIRLWRKQDAEVTAVEPDVLSMPLLDAPGGQISLTSSIYVERPPIEVRCYEAITRPGALIRIKAPRQMGKTSLMVKILHYAEEQRYLVVSLNFQRADADIFNDLNQFLKWFCINIGKKLRLPNRLEDYWNDILGSKDNCTDYFEEYLLESISSPLTLCLDEVDRVFNYPDIASDFFGLLRGWHERSKNSNLWKKLRLVVVHSTEVYTFMHINQSPFNVGLAFELTEFNTAQVQTLAARYGLHWTADEVAQLMAMVGGQPYLVGLALYHVARQEMTLQQLLETATTETGMYGEHLRRYWWALEQQPEMAAAMKHLVKTSEPVRLGAVQAFQLHSMGLLHLQGNDVTFRNELYRRYFSDRLATLDSNDTELEPVEQSLSIELREALAVVDKQERAETLARLMARSPKAHSTLLRSLSKIEDEADRVLALITLIPHLPDSLLSTLPARDIAIFQQQQGILADGICGPQTLHAIAEVLHSSNRRTTAVNPINEAPERVLNQQEGTTQIVERHSKGSLDRLGRLQTRRDDLQDEYGLLTTKLRGLRQNRSIEADAAIKTQLDIQIEAVTEELNRVEQDIERLEYQIKELNTPSSRQGANLDQFHRALLTLGYWEQQRLFRKVIKDHPAGVFLIQGDSPEYGQRWLLNRLALQISRSLKTKVVKINLGRVSSRGDIPGLWRELAGRVGLGRQSTPAEIVERVHQWWQTQNVLIVVDDVAKTIEDNLRDLIIDFWLTLANRASGTAAQSNGFKLLIFLLDHQGGASKWNLPFAKQYDSAWRPITPLRLPILTKFSADELITWIKQSSDILPPSLTDDAESVVETILQETDNGLPEPVLREICDLCGVNWYDQEDKWLSL